eukprot:5700992-Amphidinium_carterae.1
MLIGGGVTVWLWGSLHAGKEFLRTRPNPLLKEWGNTFPPFDDVQADDVVPALTQLLAEARAELDDFEARVQRNEFQSGALEFMHCIGYHHSKSLQLTIGSRSRPHHFEKRTRFQVISPQASFQARTSCPLKLAV